MTATLLEKFKNLLKGNYLFHMHTNYTDGKNTVGKYCSWASKNGIKSIVFTEHVRKKLSYDFFNLISDIEEAKQKFPTLDIWCGVESKILPSGELDIPEKILSEIQIICFAFHSFPNDIELFVQSCEKVFLSPIWKDYIRVWVHPESFPIKSGLLNANFKLFQDLISLAINEGIFIENNIKSPLPYSIIQKVPKSQLIVGLNAHSIRDIVKLNPKKNE